jgi:hypothetical protein
MAALKRRAADLRAIFAAQVALKLMDRCGLWSADDVERYGLMRVAAEAADLEIAKAGVERVTQSGRWLGRTLEGQHPHIPSLAGELVGLPACLVRAFSGYPDRVSVQILSRFGGHDGLSDGRVGAAANDLSLEDRNNGEPL